MARICVVALAWLTRNPVLFDEPVPMAGSQGWKTINR